MENLYSTIFIVDISQNPDEVETVSSRIQQLIEDHGGLIKNINRWGKKRLSYQIRKKTHGFYVEIEFNAAGRLNIPKILEGEYRLNDRVLRHMTYVISPKELSQRAKNAGKTLVDKSGKEKEAQKEAGEEPLVSEAPKTEETPVLKEETVSEAEPAVSEPEADKSEDPETEKPEEISEKEASPSEQEEKKPEEAEEPATEEKSESVEKEEENNER